jgi:hypothetical protein
VQAVAAFCQLLFILTVTVVGTRMLLLARRTHGRHELMMGAGMLLIGAIGTPLGVASGFGRTIGEMSLPLWATSTLITQAGIGLIYAFTWQVFRPAETWGKAFVVAGLALMLVGLIASVRALSMAGPEASSPLVARNGLFVGIAGYCGCFLWSAVEGFVHHAHARRRMALGLADAVIANRFLLWGVFGLMATGINIASITASAFGVDPMRSPLVLIPLGVLGFGASVAMYLAFLPPAGYLQLVRSRAARA